MPSKPTPPVILGRKNCVNCTRWRHLIDYPGRWTKRKGQDKIWRIQNVCSICRNRKLRESYSKLSPPERKARWTNANKLRQKKVEKAKEGAAAKRELMGYQNGRLLPITPFRMWLIKKMVVYGSLEELNRRTGLRHESLSNYLKGYEWNESLACDPRPVLTVPLSTVDKALTNEGSDSLRSIGYE